MPAPKIHDYLEKLISSRISIRSVELGIYLCKGNLYKTVVRHLHRLGIIILVAEDIRRRSL